MLARLNMQRYKYFAIALYTFLTFMPFAHQPANAATKGKRVNLTGQWIVKSPPFYSNSPQFSGCRSGSLPGLDTRKFVIAKLRMVQQPNGKITLNPFRSWVNLRHKKSGKFETSDPKIVKNIFSFTQSGGGFTETFKGTLSKDGNTISGQVYCKHSSGKATAKGSFTLTRIVSAKPKTKPPSDQRG
jgi:hypothetical protein